MALITNNISGSNSGGSIIGITGSVIISNSTADKFPIAGSDTIFFVSGSENAKAVFGGAIKISGSLSTEGSVTLGNSNDDVITVSGATTFIVSPVFNSGLSGSLTKLTNGTSYMIAGKNMTITTGSSGAVTLSQDDGWILSSSISTQVETTAQTFSYVSGTVQSFTVPAGITSLNAYVWGAGGGTGGYSSFRGGAGGFSSGSIAVTPGDTLYIVVGGGGSDNSGGASGPGGLGGWPNAGFGTRGDASGGGGGGYSGIFSGSSTPQQVNALLIAGGGGGGTGYKGGGGGGGTTGNAGGNGGNPGQGGTQSAGGTAGNGDTSPPRAGSALTGGNAGGTGQDDPDTTGVNDGGGGGSGYFGGGGGASDGSGGGGGSGYYNVDKVTGGSLQAGADGQNGVTSPAGTDSPYYASGIATGSAYVSGGGHGRVVLTYSSQVSLTTTYTYTTASVVMGNYGGINTIGGISVFSGSTSDSILNNNAGTGVVNFDVTQASIFYVNNPAGNITANFVNVPTTDLRMVTATVILSQSSTARIVDNVQIGGIASTINWLTGTIPTGNPDKQDVFDFNLIRSGSAWKTLGKMNSFG